MPTAKGSHLAARKSTDTEPEVRLRKAVHSLGLRFRLHRQVIPRCTPDFVFPAHRVAVFVDGCFWHGCPVHGRTPRTGPNAEVWSRKIQTNRDRDLRNAQDLRSAGWRVFRAWECDIRRDVMDIAIRIERLVRDSD